MIINKIGNYTFGEIKSQILVQPNKEEENISQNKNNLFSKETMLLAGAAIAALTFAGIAIYRSKKSSAIKQTPERNLSLVDEIIVTGKDRVRELVSKFTHDDFDSSKVFKVNMHIHSNKSDGKLSPLDILEQAKMFADKLPKGEKFTFSLTDHDTIEGVKEIVKEIRRNPKKYANVRFIPGIEMSTTYTNPNTMAAGADIDFLIYGFDINDSRLLKEISRRRKALSSATDKLIKETNAKFGNRHDIRALLLGNGKHFKYIGSNGYIHELHAALSAICRSEHAPEQAAQAMLSKYFGHPFLHIKANISTIDAAKLATEIDAFSSIAHPGKTSFSNSNLLVSGTDAATDIIKSVLDAGGDAIECHYMSYKTNNQRWWDEIRASYKPLNLKYFRTGGYDTHQNSIAAKNKVH